MEKLKNIKTKVDLYEKSTATEDEKTKRKIQHTSMSKGVKLEVVRIKTTPWKKCQYIDN